MSDAAAIDTDVLLKIASYRLADAFVTALYSPPAALGLTHIIAVKQLRRRAAPVDLDGSEQELTRLLSMIERLEPDQDEANLAADLTAFAQSEGLPFDTGEAQLLSILLLRNLSLMITGDKRALTTLPMLGENVSAIRQLAGRFACFEQVVLCLANKIGGEEIRRRVCSEPAVDGQMRLACGCQNANWQSAELVAACISAIEDIRRRTGHFLIVELSTR